jgi:PPM family protein phosphatase
MTKASYQIPHIFVSHSSKDNDFGLQLVQDLRQALNDDDAVWYDIRGGLHGGDAWWDKIKEELRKRYIFIVILSPDALTSNWVKDEIRIAWRQKNSSTGKLIIPILHRPCEVPDDLDTLQIIQCLSINDYEAAFKELLIALGVSTRENIVKPASLIQSQGNTQIQRMTEEIDAAFAEQDWLAIIRKAEFLIKRFPEAVPTVVYRLQGLAFFNEGDPEHAKEALDTALALVSNRTQRLILLDDIATIRASSGHWEEVLRYIKEALRLSPDDFNWQVRQAQTLLHLERNDEARFIYKHLESINPDDSRVQALAGILAKTYLPLAPTSQSPIKKTTPRKSSSIKLIAADKTDVGKLCEQNEDCAYKRVESSEDGNRGLFIVADGEQPYGEVASRLTVETISKALDNLFKPLPDQPIIKLPPASIEQSATPKTRKTTETVVVTAVEEQLRVAIQQANKAILRYGEQRSAARGPSSTVTAYRTHSNERYVQSVVRGPGSTVTVALVQNNQVYIANVGDSRTYRLRNQQLTPITRDHSLVARLVESKQIAPEDVYTHPQRNLIYRSLGAEHKSFEVDIFHETLQPDDTLLLCSDGLWKMVRPQTLLKVLSEESSPQKICETLIDMANANGGEDNITALVVRITRL